MVELGGAWTLIDVGAAGLVTLVVILILTGQLVPGREARYWREMALEEQRQKRRLLESMAVTEQVLKALTPPDRQGGAR